MSRLSPLRYQDCPCPRCLSAPHGVGCRAQDGGAGRGVDPCWSGTPSSGRETRIAYTRQLENGTANTFLKCMDQRTASSQGEGRRDMGRGSEKAERTLRGGGVGGEQEAGPGRGTVRPAACRLGVMHPPEGGPSPPAPLSLPLCFFFFFILHAMLLSILHAECVTYLSRFILLTLCHLISYFLPLFSCVWCFPYAIYVVLGPFYFLSMSTSLSSH